MPMKSAMQQIREDPQGREMLATTTLETPVQTVRATVSFDDAAATEMLIGANMLVLDAKVYVVTSFDAGTTNAIQFSIGSSAVLGGGSLVPFANAYDVTPEAAGAAVTGETALGADTPQFLPVPVPASSAVFVTYTGTGTAATQGQATVVLSYVPYA